MGQGFVSFQQSVIPDLPIFPANGEASVNTLLHLFPLVIIDNFRADVD